MRSRPYITLKVPSFVHPGGSADVTILLESSSETPVDFIELTLTGTEHAREPENNTGTKRTILETSVRMCEERTLGEGKFTFQASIPVPADTLCSYTGYVTDVAYEIHLRVSIPWWPDAVEQQDLRVTPRPKPRPERLPITATAEEASRPFLELTLDDRAFAPGDEITGAIALGNVHNCKMRGVALSLVGTEHIRIHVELGVESHRTTVFQKAGPEDEGRAIPFRFRVPREVSPSFDAGLMALVWGFEARLELGFPQDVVQMVPLIIGAFDGPPLPALPRRVIGQGRWREVWTEAGARAGLAIDPYDLRLTGAFHGYDVDVQIESSGDNAGSLLAEIRWPSWGLGLHIGRGSLPRRLFAAAEESFGPYSVTGRDPAQVRAIVSEPLRQAILAFESAEVDDDHAIARARRPGRDLRDVEDFLWRVNVLAKALREAEERTPPPAAMLPVLSEWQSFANELGGRLSVGAMALRDGSLEGGTFEISTHFNDGPEPAFTRVALPLDPPLPRPFDPDDPAHVAAAPPGALEITGAIRMQAIALRVAEKSIEIDVPDPLAPPARLREPMRAMLSLAHRLSGERRIGPYR